jgi:hypothetical protein
VRGRRIAAGAAHDAPRAGDAGVGEEEESDERQRRPASKSHPEHLRHEEPASPRISHERAVSIAPRLFL